MQTQKKIISKNVSIFLPTVYIKLLHVWSYIKSASGSVQVAQLFDFTEAKIIHSCCVKGARNSYHKILFS